jgi:hypothetical protein
VLLLLLPPLELYHHHHTRLLPQQLLLLLLLLLHLYHVTSFIFLPLRFSSFRRSTFLALLLDADYVGTLGLGTQ